MRLLCILVSACLLPTFAGAAPAETEQGHVIAIQQRCTTEVQNVMDTYQKKQRTLKDGLHYWLLMSDGSKIEVTLTEFRKQLFNNCTEFYAREDPLLAKYFESKPTTNMVPTS